MKVSGVDRVYKFLEKHRALRSPFEAWLDDVKRASWHTPQDISAHYSRAGFLKDNRVVFRLKGNQYRLDVLVAFETQVVIIMRVGTHQDYDKWTW